MIFHTNGEHAKNIIKLMWIWEEYHFFEEEKTLTVVYLENFEKQKQKTMKNVLYFF